MVSSERERTTARALALEAERAAREEAETVMVFIENPLKREHRETVDDG
jgi:hypothetical protein